MTGSGAAGGATGDWAMPVPKAEIAAATHVDRHTDVPTDLIGGA